jgi:tetratricopeptide (TPR) repeat protein
VSTPDPDLLPPRWQAAWCWGAPAATVAAVALIVWGCFFNPKVRFLTPGPGQWIVYPLPPELGACTGVELMGTFQRDFVLDEKPAAARVSWRCLTRGELIVNSRIVQRSADSSANWKTTSHVDIAPFLRQGTNEILVTVANQLGPPALSLALEAGKIFFASDESWDVSVSGSNWRRAQSASTTPLAENGNELSPLETTSGAWRRCWPWLVFFVAISICGMMLWQYYIGRIRSASGPIAFPKIVLILLAAVWALLFLHNFPSLPVASGFDASSHLEYVSYIQEHGRLPKAAEGWEMFQPPLYYLMAAGLLQVGHCAAFQPSGMMLLRFLSLLIGAADLALIFAGLRMIFPNDWKKPLTGLVLAAFLPAQVCLLHYTTNETLSALFVTASLVVGLHLVRAGQPWGGWYCLLGIVLGLALLSKASAVLAVPVIFGALVVKLAARREQSARIWLEVVAAPFLICVIVGGWPYLRLWREYGNPFVGNWNAEVGDLWWQYKGFHTPHYYFSFGNALIHPFFSGVHGFWDGFYTTLWGDGLWGGKVDFWSRPPWNYDFMTVGFILALIPTTLVLTGLARALGGCFRAARLPWVLLLGAGWFFAFAILGMSFKVASYAQTKAFYGLPVLLPFCALGAMGFEFWAGRGRWLRCVTGVALGIWLVNLYASFWIRPEAVRTRLSSAIAASVFLKADPAESLLDILKRYPNDSQTIIWLAAAEAKTHPEQAVNRLEHALKIDPANAQLETELSWDLGLCGKVDEGLAHARHAVELAPENLTASQTWCALALRNKNYAEVVTAGRAVLSLNPTDLQTHFNLGFALMNLGQGAEAIRHFSAIVNFKPAWAEAWFCRGLCLLAQPGKRADALQDMKEAIRLEPANRAWQADLQKALGNQ